LFLILSFLSHFPLFLSFLSRSSIFPLLNFRACLSYSSLLNSFLSCFYLFHSSFLPTLVYLSLSLSLSLSCFFFSFILLSSIISLFFFLYVPLSDCFLFSHLSLNSFSVSSHLPLLSYPFSPVLSFLSAHCLFIPLPFPDVPYAPNSACNFTRWSKEFYQAHWEIQRSWHNEKPAHATGSKAPSW
jgi:hypothetical protein